jgi:hypothetical protein
MDAKYYEVVVQIKLQTEDSKGNVKIKKLKEVYLVDAMSVTEAEARVVKQFEGFSQEFSVLQVKNSKIIEVINADEKSDRIKVVVERAKVILEDDFVEDDSSN